MTPLKSGSPKRILPPVYLLAAVFVMIGLHYFGPVMQLVSSPYRYLGILLLLGGFATVVRVADDLRRAGTTIKPFEPSSVLLTEGLYRVTRNPIYVSMSVGLLGLAVLLGSLSPFLVVPIFVYLIGRRFVRAEEAVLEQVFGAQYSAYKARVRRWI